MGKQKYLKDIVPCDNKEHGEVKVGDLKELDDVNTAIEGAIKALLSGDPSKVKAHFNISDEEWDANQITEEIKVEFSDGTSVTLPALDLSDDEV